MFYYICGKPAHLDLNFAVIDVGGVGYKLTVSATTHQAIAAQRGNASATVKLYTHMAVREDDVELFGFATETELASFKMLISVSGVGPKAAMAILSILTPEKFAVAVCTEDTKAISKASGVGAKTAARIVLELRDKLKKENPGFATADVSREIVGGTTGGRSNLGEAQDALIVLGYTRGEAQSALKSADPTLDVEALIKHALKQLMKI
ncbi:MAG: Holliday junction branch migration protein RuvA [Clostridia bacterium]|nr:Holliday junction branch migration protein RuvA [Clostridia bacterium]